jgi:excisionase family DNA binding protein
MKTKPRPAKQSKRPKQAPKPPVPSVNGAVPLDPSDVMTLAETAAFLRVSEHDVRQMADEGKLPARRVSGQWRFLKSALLEWFRQPEPKPGTDDWREANRRILESAGSMADDETIPEMLENIYKERKRHPVSELQD